MCVCQCIKTVCMCVHHLSFRDSFNLLLLLRVCVCVCVWMCVYSSLIQHFLHDDLFNLMVVFVRQLSKQCYKPQNNCLHAHRAHKLSLAFILAHSFAHFSFVRSFTYITGNVRLIALPKSGEIHINCNLCLLFTNLIPGFKWILTSLTLAEEWVYDERRVCVCAYRSG